ncbi:hypothetical protein KSU1_D0813 [Candidatus Jettenia caeni]|uniref:Uncharacterized protein n=1 Tax=Candidatus Jettenia caeni TaxID=247490 RepID=I3IQX7_9BACT|nr:hypothetical protein KSU1_D0813 [Candidatus Jettenia caeni]
MQQKDSRSGTNTPFLDHYNKVILSSGNISVFGVFLGIMPRIYINIDYFGN